MHYSKLWNPAQLTHGLIVNRSRIPVEDEIRFVVVTNAVRRRKRRVGLTRKCAFVVSQKKKAPTAIGNQ